MSVGSETTSFRVSDYLLIELGDVVVGLTLCLNVDGVILNTFGCGHDWLSIRKTTGMYS